MVYPGYIFLLQNEPRPDVMKQAQGTAYPPVVLPWMWIVVVLLPLINSGYATSETKKTTKSRIACGSQILIIMIIMCFIFAFNREGFSL